MIDNAGNCRTCTYPWYTVYTDALRLQWICGACSINSRRMTEMSVRKQAVNCKVPGCEECAVVEVYWCDQYESPNIEYRNPYAWCQYLCEHHMQVNESGRVGKVEPRGIAAYPFVNRGAMDQGWCEYKWLDNGEMVNRKSLPAAHVQRELMPPPILNVQSQKPSVVNIGQWFRQKCIELGKRFAATAR